MANRIGNGGDLLFTEAGQSWLLDEDGALKTLIQGMTVSDQKSASRPVRVWFGLPDMEIKDQTYPYAIIDMIDITEARERALQGVINMQTDADGNDLPSGQLRRAEYPVPYDIDYQVSFYSRNPRHDRQILQQMFAEKIPGRRGALYVTTDNTRRRINLLDMVTRDTVEDGRRLFCKVFSIRISSEMSPHIVNAASLEVQTLNLTDVAI